MGQDYTYPFLYQYLKYAEPARISYMVSTCHEDDFCSGFIVPVEILAKNPVEAAQIRFEKLEGNSRASCLALKVSPRKGEGRATVVPVKKTTTPRIKVEDETTYKVGV